MIVGINKDELYPIYMIQSEQNTNEGWITEVMADVPSPIVERHRKAMKELKEVNSILGKYYDKGVRLED